MFARTRTSLLLVVAVVVTACSPVPPPPTSSTTPATPGATSPAASPATSSTPPATSSTPPASPPASALHGVVKVSSAEQLLAALAAAAPGQVIELAPGRYESRQRWTAAANGTASQPITLRGPASAQLTSKDVKANYGLWITGDFWRIEGVTIREASKGIVLDGSVGTVIDGVTVTEIGEEGVHFRSCSRDGVLRNSTIAATGRTKPRFGEGVYVGSANSNWDKYSCDDGRDNSENVVIEHNTFRDIPAEGADLKEGTDSGTLRNNVFDNTGWSGENSADSAVDAKGNNWLIEANVVRNPTGKALDGLQTHQVFPGYGTKNVFRGNTIEGTWPGFGIGLYPAADNVVECSNRAPGAARGLVGDGQRAAQCR